jgi:hypothetical protein
MKSQENRDVQLKLEAVNNVELANVTGGFVRMVYDPFAPIHGRDVPGGAPYCGTVVGMGKWVPRS